MPPPVKVRSDLRKIQALNDYLKSVPRGALKVGLKAFSEYVLTKLRPYPAYKYVSRRAAYGRVSSDGAPPGYFSWRQFRYVMARRAEGKIDPGFPHRFGKLQRGWRVLGEPFRSRIENPTPWADVVLGTGQSRHEKRVGWVIYLKTIANNLKGGIVKARAAVNQFLKERKAG